MSHTYSFGNFFLFLFFFNLGVTQIHTIEFMYLGVVGLWFSPPIFQKLVPTLSPNFNSKHFDMLALYFNFYFFILFLDLLKHILTKILWLGWKALDDDTFFIEQVPYCHSLVQNFIKKREEIFTFFTILLFLIVNVIK